MRALVSRIVFVSCGCAGSQLSVFGIGSRSDTRSSTMSGE